MHETDDAPFRRLFGVVIDPQTYRNAVYLFLAFPLGVLYFTVLVAGGATGIATLPVIVGIPILAAVLVFATHLAALEGRLANGLLGTAVTYEPTQPDEETVVSYAIRVALDPKTSLGVGYLLSKFAIGIAAFTALVTSSALALSFAFAPLLYDLGGVSYQFGAWEVQTLSGAGVLSLVGVGLALATLHLVNLGAWVVGEYTEVMLGWDEASGSDTDGPHRPGRDR